MTARRRRSGGSRRRRSYYWEGAQWANTNVSTSGTLIQLASVTGGEFMPRTLKVIRGNIRFTNAGTDSLNGDVHWGAKIMPLTLTDGGALTGDVNGIDTDEEDIAWRQLWMYSNQLHQEQTGTKADTIDVEIHIKVQWKWPPTGKHILGLLVDAAITNRLQTSGYLRCLFEAS